MARSRSRSPKPVTCSDSSFLEFRDVSTRGGEGNRTPSNSTLDLDAITVYVSPHDQNQWADQAAKIFKTYGVVILKDLFSMPVTNMVWQSLQDLHARWGAKFDQDRIGNRCPGRYDMGSAYNTHHLTHLPGYLEALEEFAANGGAKLLEQLGGYKFVGGQGSLCLAHTDNWQPLHSDIRGPWQREVQALRQMPEHVPCIDLMFTVHPLTSRNGAMRILPGQPAAHDMYLQYERRLAPKLDDESEASKSSQLYPLPPGCGILRDIRVWHGGVPSTADEDRYLPVLQFYSDFVVDACASNPSEGKGVCEDMLRSKLSDQARHTVAPHIVRQAGDEEPWLDQKAAIWPGEFY